MSRQGGTVKCGQRAMFFCLFNYRICLNTRSYLAPPPAPPLQVKDQQEAEKKKITSQEIQESLQVSFK